MLTDTEIKRAIRTATAETTLNDHSLGRGAGSLRLRIRPGDKGASATWLAFWKQGGVRATKVLGRYPAMTAAKAREAYREEVAPKLLNGKDPRVTVAGAGNPTVERMFRAYVDTMKARGAASWPELERALLEAKDNAADALGRNRLAGSIEAADVAAYLSKFYKRGARGAADHHRAYISAAFGWALKAATDYTVDERQDWGVKFNPAALVRRDMAAIGRRDRNLSAPEIAALWHAADAKNPHWSLATASCIRLLLLCGQRVQETLRVEGADIDLEAATWNMPAERTKGRKRPHVIPLGPIAVEVFRTLIKAYGRGPLFAGRFGTSGAYIDHRTVKQAVDRWLATPGVKVAQFQTRDLRRTWKSRTGEIGISREIRDLIQQHARQDTGSLHYDRADYLPQMREAIERWEAWLVMVVGVTASPP